MTMSTNKTTHNNSTPEPRLGFVNRFYAPDLSATSQILTDVAEALASRGHRVLVFTSAMSYDGSKYDQTRETLNGVEIRRIWSTRMGRGSAVGRMIDYLTFYVSITTVLLFSVARGDVIVAKTDPPMMSIPIGWVARVRGAKLINWLQDIFPETATELGFGSQRNLFLQALRSLRNRSLRRAEMNVTIGTRMAEIVEDFGVPADRISVIENFADDAAIERSEKFSPKLREEWGFEPSDFIVGYSGNLGRAHDLDTMLNAAALLHGTPRIKFLFIGGGFHYELLKRLKRERGLSNVFLRPYQPRARLHESLALPNLHWATLKPGLEGYIVPSKVYGIAAAGRPLLMIGDPAGEIGRIIAEFPFGACVQIGNSEQAKDFVLRLQADSKRASAMGEAARSFVDKRASKRNTLTRWGNLIDQITKQN
ncbi:MAG: glycosyltransferase family 4 protein [Pseudomonadota bacterium]